MIKEVPCMECDGKGFIAKFGEYSVWSERCPNCGGTGIVKVPMTNSDRIRAMSNEELAHLLCFEGWQMSEVQECLTWLQQLAEEDT